MSEFGYDFEDDPYSEEDESVEDEYDLQGDNLEYMDYLRAGVPDYKIPWDYQLAEINRRRAERNRPYPSVIKPRVQWWEWLMIFLFILAMLAIACGPLFM